MTRRLAAIVIADVVDDTAHVRRDETGTLAALAHQRGAFFGPAVTAHGGRIVKLMGDGTFMEFSSVVDAVRCAMAIQTALAESPSAEGAKGSRLRHRIGIDLGDVVVDGEDLHGDGVNVAARL